MAVINSIADREQEMKAWRHMLHQHPETSYEEVWTSDFIAEKLRAFGIEIHRGIGKTGIVGVLHGSGKGTAAIGLRADMDALPMQEKNEFSHASKTPGRMHACGHDGHSTMLLGAAQYLAETRNFDGTVYFIFQPAEEGGNGGEAMIKDGLWDAFHGYHMGVTAENVAEKFQITREQQDKFALKSQEKALKAQKENRFKDEIINFKIKSSKAEIDFNKDEHPREGINMESLSRLKPVFKKDGTVTAGNASGINDGAAAVAIMSAGEAQKRGIEKLVSIRSWASCGVDPALMGTGPIPSSKKALDLAGWSVKDVDLFEINEAFAAQSLAVLKTLSIPEEKVNVNGGAIALGHPIGASGTRILVTLIHEMIKRDVKKGLATLCIGGGMGIAMCIER